MNYLDTAEKLADHLIKTPEYQAFTSAKKVLEEDVSVQLLLQNLDELKEEISQHRSKGEKLPQDVAKKIEEMNKSIEDNLALQNYNDALQGFQTLLVNVNDVISEKSGVGLSTPTGCGGGCPKKGA